MAAEIVRERTRMGIGKEAKMETAQGTVMETETDGRIVALIRMVVVPEWVKAVVVHVAASFVMKAA